MFRRCSHRHRCRTVSSHPAKEIAAPVRRHSAFSRPAALGSRLGVGAARDATVTFVKSAEKVPQCCHCRLLGTVDKFLPSHPGFCSFSVYSSLHFSPDIALFLTCKICFLIMIPRTVLLLLWMGSLCSHWIFCEKGPLLSSLLSLGWHCCFFLYISRIQCSRQAPGGLILRHGSHQPVGVLG